LFFIVVVAVIVVVVVVDVGEKYKRTSKCGRNVECSINVNAKLKYMKSVRATGEEEQKIHTLILIKLLLCFNL